MLYLVPLSDNLFNSSGSTNSRPVNGEKSEQTNKTNVFKSVPEDPVDVMLWKMDGQIKRKRDPTL